jgi:hypothetical protein
VDCGTVLPKIETPKRNNNNTTDFQVDNSNTPSRKNPPQNSDIAQERTGQQVSRPSTSKQQTPHTENLDSKIEDPTGTSASTCGTRRRGRHTAKKQTWQSKKGSHGSHTQAVALRDRSGSQGEAPLPCRQVGRWHLCPVDRSGS